MHDVAERAGVAVGTVSRYLNGEQIRPTNRKQIDLAIEQLGYKRNIAAAAIRRATSNTVGFIVASFDEFHANILRLVSHRMHQEGYVVVPYVVSPHSTDKTDIQAFFSSIRTDAIIVSGDVVLRERIERLVRLDVPLIVYCNDVYGLDVDRVLINDRKDAYRATRHLIEMKHRNIGILRGTPQDSTAIGRYEGYCEALQEAGIAHVPPLQVRSNGWHEQDGYLAMYEFCKQPEPPTAIYCSNYLLALGAIRFLKEASVSIPEDISLISHGDTSYFPLLCGGITALRMPDEMIANSICHMFFTRTKGEAVELTRTLNHESDLVVRSSVKLFNPFDERDR